VESGESARKLEIDSVSVRFGGLTALDRVSIDAPPGRIIGVIGPNGAGKATLFNIVCGFVRPDAGTLARELARRRAALSPAITVSCSTKRMLASPLLLGSRGDAARARRCRSRGFAAAKAVHAAVRAGDDRPRGALDDPFAACEGVR
jgi:energy-coupling factor transporter ATP-binding protein EcfA2